MPNEGIICQACGIEAPVKYVEFYQNIGMLVMRQQSHIKGNLCKSCIHSEFWKRTMTTLGIGWLGTISIILGPIFVLMNTVRYLGALGLPKVPPGAARPQLTQQAVEALNRFADDLVNRINGGQPVNDVARDIAAKARVTPGQVLLYVRALAQRSAPPQKTYGFPVMPPTAPPPIPVQPIPQEQGPAR